MKKHILSIILLLFIIQISAYGQKLKTEEFTISFKELENKKMAFCGRPKDVYEGAIKMKVKGEGIVLYNFFFPMVGKDNSYLSIKDKNGVIDPILFFDEELNAFILYPETENEKKIYISREKSIEELILEGVEIWYNEAHPSIVSE